MHFRMLSTSEGHSRAFKTYLTVYFQPETHMAKLWNGSTGTDLNHSVHAADRLLGHRYCVICSENDKKHTCENYVWR